MGGRSPKRVLEVYLTYLMRAHIKKDTMYISPRTYNISVGNNGKTLMFRVRLDSFDIRLQLYILLFPSYDTIWFRELVIAWSPKFKIYTGK